MFKCLSGFLLFLFTLQNSIAGMSIVGTRIIFPGTEKEVTVRTKNKTTMPILSQVWVDDGSANEDINKSRIPFIVTPPIFRVEPGQGQSIRMIYNGMSLPQDRESVFWFNLLEIPPVDTNNAKQKLQIAFRTRIKIFYRPQAVVALQPQKINSLLHWSVIHDAERGAGVRLENSGPYYFSFNDAKVYANEKEVSMSMTMVAPKSTEQFFPQEKLTNISRLEYSFINDMGGSINKVLLWDKNKGLVPE